MTKSIIGIIGGTGLTQLKQMDITDTVEVSTEYGKPSAEVQLGTIGKQSIVFLPRHGHPHSIAPHHINYRANIRALQKMNVSAIIAVNAVGGISGDALIPGAVVIPHDIIDYTWGREHSFFDGIANPLEHIDFSHPYDALWRSKFIKAAVAMGIKPMVDFGVYGATQGPRLESPAEITRMERDGCSIVGMTGMPEAALAKELAIPYVAIGLVVNPAAGKSAEEITMEGIHQITNTGMLQIMQLIHQGLNV